MTSHTLDYTDHTDHTLDQNDHTDHTLEHYGVATTDIWGLMSECLLQMHAADNKQMVFMFTVVY